MTLFDPDDYIARGRTPKTPRRKREPGTATCVPGHGWCLVATIAGPLPELHRLNRDPRWTRENKNRGRIFTRCDLVGRLVEQVPPGTPAVLCATCLDR